MAVMLAPMWKCTGSCSSVQVSQNGSHARFARSGAPRSCGSDVMFTPRAAECSDALGFRDAMVDAPCRHERHRKESVPGIGLDLCHAVVVDLDGELDERAVVDHAQGLATKTNRAGVDHLRVDAALVEHLEAHDRVVRADVNVVDRPFLEPEFGGCLVPVPADDSRRARLAEHLSVAHPMRFTVDLLDTRHTVAILRRRGPGEEVRGLGPVGVGVDDQRVVVQHLP